jgi:hypothetical protein
VPEIVRRVRPTPTDAYLANPHKGCCTFQHFNGDPLYPGTKWSEEGPLEFPAATEPVAPGYLPCTVAYCRWFWRVLEPEQGRYDFSMIDGALETCRARGQTLAVRLMAFGSHGQPTVPDWYASRFPMAEYAPHRARTIVAPIHDSPEYLEHWGNLIREFGRRYDGNPLLESIDVAFIGPWGEGAGECSRGRCREFADLWREAFPTTPRIALIEGPQLVEGVRTGAGWRCDCFGDLRETGSPHVPGHVAWNHMFDCIPQELAIAGAQEAWRIGPVHMEACGVPMHWFRGEWDLDFIIEQGWKYHTTYFMPKSTALPEPWIPRLSQFCRRLGYRFVFRQAIFIASTERPGSFRLQAWIENVGVAPLYRRYDLVLRLRHSGGEDVIPIGDVDVRQWVPGDVWLDRVIDLPPGFRPGWAEAAVGLVDPVTREARVRFANKEAFSDRWLSLGPVQLA